MLREKIYRVLFIILGALVMLTIAVMIIYKVSVRIMPPEITDLSALQFHKVKVTDSLYICEKGRLKHRSEGIWELYLQGKPFEMGVANGMLTRELIKKQEEAFIGQIRQMIPSDFYLRFLKYFVSYFNRNLNEYISKEFREEIYGISFFTDPSFKYIGSGYARILNYHAAHDIGHALQNMNLVGCTALAVWDGRSADSSLLIGRNFDFYMGDEFSKEKIICFMSPDSGYQFMMITWGGMTGVVSGMNENGLTVSLNAAKSSVPYGARTPVSLVAREILQYAKNIREATEIAKKRETFVSESFMIGSAYDHKVVVIEKTPDITAIYDPDTNFIVLTNHFQSEELFQEKLNQENIKNETSVYRHDRVIELLGRDSSISVPDMADILRNRFGLKEKDIGMGNEKSVNQLIAHHSVIFQPEKLRVWIALPPFQLGKYICYDLKKIFNDTLESDFQSDILIDSLMVPEDNLLETSQWKDYLKYRELTRLLEGKPVSLEEGFDSVFISLNPEFFMTYRLLGDYYLQGKNYQKAGLYYKVALAREVTSAYERNLILERLQSCLEK